MMRPPLRGVRLFAAWAAATALVSSAAWEVVSAAEDRVSEKPLSRLIAIPSPTTSPVPAPPAQSTVTLPDPAQPTPPEIAAPTVTTSSTTSTTTAPDQPWTTEAIATPAGVVLVSSRPGEVRLEAVTPIPGWSYEVKRAEPDQVEVRFAGHGHAEVFASARWLNGALETEVDSD